MIAILVSILFMLTVGCTQEEESPPVLVFEVDAGEFDRVDTVVSLEAPGSSRNWSLFEVTGGLRTPVPVQLDTSSPARLYFVLAWEMGRGTTRRFHLFDSDSGVEQQPWMKSEDLVKVVDESGRYLEVVRGSTPVLRYNYGMVDPPDPSTSQLQVRNAYIHPVWSPEGGVVTDDFHPDHVHQRGIWYAWTETEFDGRTPDFWNLGEGTGTVRFDRFDSFAGGKVFGRVGVRHNHVDLSAPEGEVDVLAEKWDIRVYAVGGKTRGYFLFDIDSTQENVAAHTLRLLEYHYGGLAFRGARDWTPEIVRFLTSTGLDRIDGDGTGADWCMIGGLVDEVPRGVVIFSHPENWRSPQHLRIHPRMPYLAFTPVKTGDFDLEPGASLRTRYRILVFDGSVGADMIDPVWNDYAYPPAVRIIED